MMLYEVNDSSTDHYGPLCTISVKHRPQSKDHQAKKMNPPGSEYASIRGN